MSGKNVWIVNMPCCSNEDAETFANAVTNATRMGFEIESSGINTLPSGFSRAWAIMTKPEKEEEEQT